MKLGLSVEKFINRFYYKFTNFDRLKKKIAIT